MLLSLSYLPGVMLCYACMLCLYVRMEYSALWISEKKHGLAQLF